jgi:hypothetical protein
VSAGGEAEDEDTGLGIAKAGDGLAPVVPIEVGAALNGGDLGAVVAEARAAAAGDDFGIEDLQQEGEPNLIKSVGQSVAPGA